MQSGIFDLHKAKYIDLTHTLSADIPQWDSECGFSHKIKFDYSDCKTDVKFRGYQLQMKAGTGTHMDAPAHCIANANTIDEIPLHQLIAPCYVINVADKAHASYMITADDIKEFENKYGVITKKSIVLFHTGWDKFWNQRDKYRNNLVFPSVSQEAAELLLKREVNGLGIDTLSPDRADSQFPVHQLFLTAGKFILENITQADRLPPINSYIFALPIKIKDGTEAPVRIIGIYQ